MTQTLNSLPARNRTDGEKNIGIRHVGIHARNPADLAEFYRNVLGMEIVGGIRELPVVHIKGLRASVQLQTRMIFRLAKCRSAELIMKSATSAREIVKPNIGRWPLQVR
jgi:hypothetical protein